MSNAAVAVAPDVFDASSKVFGQDLAGDLRTIWSTTTSSLQGCASMAGSDQAGSDWAAQYDQAAGAAVATVDDLASACMQIAALLQQTGFNHGQAEAASDPTRMVPTPPDTTSYQLPVSASAGVCLPGHDVPLAAGGTVSPPHGWSWLEHAVGYVWPNGDPNKLRAAATAWHATANSLDAAQGYVAEAVSGVVDQQSPEIGDALTVCSSMGAHLMDASAICSSLASSCTDLAAHVEQAHKDIENELKSFVEWTVGIEATGAVVGFFTAGGAELAAQAAESARIGATGARIASIIRTMVTVVRTVTETITAILDRIAAVGSKLRVILGARISKVVANVADRLPKGAPEVTDEEAALDELEISQVAPGGVPPVGPRPVDEVLADLRSGRRKPNLEVDSEEDVLKIFAELSSGGRLMSLPSYEGEMVELADGARVGLRLDSSSGGAVVDVFKSDGSYAKVHLP